MRPLLLPLAALLALTGCMGHELGNGLSRFDSKSFWHSGSSADDAATDAGSTSDAGASSE